MRVDVVSACQVGTTNLLLALDLGSVNTRIGKSTRVSLRTETTVKKKTKKNVIPVKLNCIGDGTKQ